MTDEHGPTLESAVRRRTSRSLPDVLAGSFGDLSERAACVLERGNRAVLGEAASMATGELAGVESGGHDLALGDLDLDAAADEARIERVVVGVKAQVWVRRDPRDPAASHADRLSRVRVGRWRAADEADERLPPERGAAPNGGRGGTSRPWRRRGLQSSPALRHPEGHRGRGSLPAGHRGPEVRRRLRRSGS